MNKLTDLQVENHLMVEGEIQIQQTDCASLHYGNRGKLDDRSTFNPDSNRDGLWIEASDQGAQSGGLFINGNGACLWSLGEGDLLKLYGDTSADSPKMRVNRQGTLILKDASGQDTIRIDGQTGQIAIKDWSLSVPDSVFEPSYELPSLAALQAYITEHQHLPDVPSAQEIHASGVNLGQFCMSLLKKVEELSLYVLQQQELIQQQNDRLTQLEQSVELKAGEANAKA